MIPERVAIHRLASRGTAAARSIDTPWLGGRYTPLKSCQIRTSVSAVDVTPVVCGGLWESDGAVERVDCYKPRLSSRHHGKFLSPLQRRGGHPTPAPPPSKES
jgi:hypothetical protein